MAIEPIASASQSVKQPVRVTGIELALHMTSPITARLISAFIKQELP
jgi:hypothetical protein